MIIKQQIKFGGTDKDIDELAQKVLSGEKTATSSLLAYYKAGLKELSTVGDLLSVLDSSDNIVTIVKVTRIQIIRFGDITESFAIEEGDESLANWKAIHHPYYMQQLAEIGETLTYDTELVCEWFHIVDEEFKD
ncbi:ASCH domain-containing protein [Prevotella sp. 10(H)]|uniref:ASCH domain-containing protein n=1 Tax=Prevotella sp. 10(H) TaxID=1158294 RepID=UPI0004A72AD1|nr:ASCH domain-containing protein [Prevotella sp. 10(H)]